MERRAQQLACLPAIHVRLGVSPKPSSMLVRMANHPVALLVKEQGRHVRR